MTEQDTATRNRDDFSRSTIIKIAKRVAYLCSNPDCMSPTIGPSQSDDGTINVGVAAHITAAAPRGPRYDPSLTREQRRHQSNGIWLCQTHGKLVDSDDAHFTVEKLLSWKRMAESRAFGAIAAPNAIHRQTIDVEGLDSDDRAQIDQLGLPAQENVESVLGRSLAAAKSDLTALKRQQGWPDAVIALNLKMTDGESVLAFNAAGLAAAITTFNEIAIVAPPGTGKTTTLIQVADAILTRGRSVAAFIPLSEWSSRPDSLLQSLARRQAFRNLSEQHLALLAIHGRFVLVLDGWNELDTESRRRASAEIKLLRRDLPNIGIIVSTRRQALDVPISGPVVEIEPLNRGQQLEIARALRGTSADSILRHAAQTSGVRDLIAIPLYLTAWLALTADGSLPTTREEVLRRFVAQHERMSERAEVLRQKLFGFETQFLSSLAFEATAAANTSIPDAKARSVVRKVEDVLIADGQITIAPQPMDVLDVLVSQHLLVRSDAGAGGISFQHQQFQEWYASLEAETLVLASAAGDPEARRRLREDMLNVPVWEEPILFACERVSRADQDGLKAVSAVIFDTLAIDPMLAAMMIRRSCPEVWGLISVKTISFATEWHKSGDRIRAFRFMTGTGRADFAELVWESISTKEGYDRSAHFAPHWFVPSSLGPEGLSRYKTLDPEHRRSLLWDFCHYGGQEGVEFAVEACRTDPSVEVVSSVVEFLHYEGADAALATLLQTVSPEVWQRLAARIKPSSATGDFRSRLLDEKRKLAQTSEGEDKLRILLQLAEEGKYDNAEEVVALALEVKYKDYHAEHWVFTPLAARYPQQLSRGIVERLLQGGSLPAFASRFVDIGDPEQQPMLRAIALGVEAREGRAKQVAAQALSEESVGSLIQDMFVALDDLRDKRGQRADPERQRYNGIVEVLNMVNGEALVASILSVSAAKPHQIAALAELLFRWRNDDRDDSTLGVDHAMHDGLSRMLAQWVEDLVRNPDADRHELSEVASAIKRVATPDLLPSLKKLIDADLDAWRKERAETARLRSEGRSITQANMSYTSIYRQAIEAFQGDTVRDLLLTYIGNPDFEVEAAFALRQYGTDEPIAPPGGGMGRPAYEKILPARHNRLMHQKPASAVAIAVLNRMGELISTGIIGDLQRATALATAVTQMDYGDGISRIDAVLSSPGPTSAANLMSGRYSLLYVLVFAGEVIPATLIRRGFNEALSEASKEPWRAQEGWWAVERWLELMVFSDTPEQIVECLAAVPPELKRGHHLDKILFALSHADPKEALNILIALGDQIPSLPLEHGYVSALAQMDTPDAGRHLLSIALNPQHASSTGREWLGTANALTGMLRRHPEVRREFMNIVMRGGLSVSPLLMRVLPAILDQSEIPTLIRTYNAHGGDGMSQTIEHAVRELAVVDQPIEGMANAYEREPADLTSLRSELFKIHLEKGANSLFAARLLGIIDRQRDTYGRTHSEPRHPDIASGAPWPAIDVR
jgi:hypothetical protein